MKQIVINVIYIGPNDDLILSACEHGAHDTLNFL